MLGITSVHAADEDFFTGRFGACMDQSGGVTVEMLDCIGEEALWDLSRDHVWLSGISVETMYGIIYINYMNLRRTGGCHRSA